MINIAGIIQQRKSSLLPLITPKAALAFALAIAVSPCTVSASDLIDFYGKLDISYDALDPGEERWQNNVSRVGVRGGLALSEETRLLYQLEQGIDPVHGGLTRDTFFSMRNTFVGVEHERFGKLMVGTYDSPLKLAQGKIDVFNDHLGDIQTLFAGEIRARDSISYTSPLLGDIVTARLLFVPADDDFGNSHSLSLEYDKGGVFWAFAADIDMRKNDQRVARTMVHDSFRATLVVPFEAWQLGTMIQTSRLDDPGSLHDWEFGFTISASKTIAPFLLQAQYSASDILVPDGRQLLFGLSTSITKDLRAYGIVSFLDRGDSQNAASLGLEFKF